MAKSLSSTYKLVNGNTIPVLGLGVWASPTNLTTKSCLVALNHGYRLIDTAEIYQNEAEVGDAVCQSGLARKDIFITTKIYRPSRTPQQTRAELISGIEKVGGKDGYVDMMLVHNANIGAEPRKKLWVEMEKLHQEGRILNLGVSNFGIGHLQHLKSFAKTFPPVVNQLELHPWLQQREIVSFCEDNAIVVQAYCPLVRNQKANDPTLKAIADKAGKTTAQVLIRYCIQKNWLPLPKSDNPERIKANGDVFGWELSDEAMNALDDAPQERPLVIAVNNKEDAM